jgi:hypothetical protein
MANAAILDTRERVYAGIVLTSLAYLPVFPAGRPV